MPTKKRKSQRGRAAALMVEINSTIGKPVVKLGNDPYFDIMRIPTGSLTIDRITGGGFVLGRHVEIFGDESSCKSFIMYRTMALSQERGNICALIDPEHTFDASWFDLAGGRPDELLLEHPETAEEAITVMALLAQKQKEGEPIEVVGIDSIATLLPLEEFEKAPDEEPRLAGQARMMSRALRRITAMNRRTLFLWTNQTRMRIGAMVFGNPVTTPGGKAMRFYATTRVELKRGERIKKKKQVGEKGQLRERNVTRGVYVLCRSEKEKSAIPHQEGMFEFNTEDGEIVLESEIINLGLTDGLIERKGNTFYFEDSDGFEWSGVESNFRTLLRENDGVRSELIESIQDMTIQLSVPRRDNGDG